MSWLISKKPEEDEENKKNYKGESSNMIVSSHLRLKGDPNNKSKSGALDKEVVLRRIRQRKRVNKFRSLVGSFFPSTKTTCAANGDEDHVPVQVLHQSATKWVENPFVDP